MSFSANLILWVMPVRLDGNLVSKIGSILIETAAIPLPGGQGVWFAENRRLKPRQLTPAEPFIRCYVCLALLGDGEGEQRWNPKEWWPHANAWFDIYCPGLGHNLDAPRWAYLLAAMHEAARNFCSAANSRRHLVPFVDDCKKRALERLKPMSQRSDENEILTFIPARKNSDLSNEVDLSWQFAEQTLNGSGSIRAEMLYFLYVLHASLGVAQHSLDVKYSSRKLFYDRLIAVLERPDLLAPTHREIALRLATALSKTALMSQGVEQPIIDGPLAARLPSCFQLATCRCRPPLRELSAAKFPADSVARRRLIAAHDLAIAVADLAMDFFRSGEKITTSFFPESYRYLHSLIRYGPALLQEVLHSEPCKQDDLAAEQSTVIGVPMTRAFARRMGANMLAKPARERAADLLLALSD